MHKKKKEGVRHNDRVMAIVMTAVEEMLKRNTSSHAHSEAPPENVFLFSLLFKR